MSQLTASAACILVCTFAACGTAAAQTVEINTSLHTLAALSGTPQVYDVTGFTFLAQKIAVVCRGQSGAELVNVTNPTSIAFANIPPSPSSASIQDAAISGTTLYLAQSGGNILRYDVSFPATPVFLGSFGAGTENLFISGSFLYAARGIHGGGGALEIWNIAGPSPSMVFTYDNGALFLCRDVTVAGGRAYAFNQITTSNFSTVIFNVATPASATIIGTVFGGGQSGSIYFPPGNMKTVLVCCTPGGAGIVQTWDVSIPAVPVFLAAYQSTTNTAARNVRTFGRYAYVAAFLDGLRVLDLANPADLQLVGTYDPFPTNIGLPATSGFYGVFAESEGRVYLTETATQSGVLAGVYAVTFTPQSPLRLQLSTTGVGDFILSVSGAPPFSPIFNLVSVFATLPIGQGPVAGLGFDALTVFYAYQFPPFQDACDFAGAYYLQLPPQTLSPGYQLSLRPLAYHANGFAFSEIGAIQF